MLDKNVLKSDMKKLSEKKLYAFADMGLNIIYFFILFEDVEYSDWRNSAPYKLFSEKKREYSNKKIFLLL